MVAACVKHECEPQVDAGCCEYVGASLHVGVAQLETKAVYDPAAIESPADVIKNLWVIQFNGTTDDSKIIGEPMYIEDFSSFDGELKLVATTKPCVIWFIANTFEGIGVFSLPQGTTLGELKGKRRFVTASQGPLSKELVEIDGEKVIVEHPIFNGSVTKTVFEGVQLSASLKRNVAKVQVTVTNSTADKAPSEQVVIEAITLRSVPSISYYLTNLEGLAAPFPSSTSFSKVDLDQIAWEPGADGKTMILPAFYLPANLRGKATANTSPASKNKYAPAEATYLQVWGHYTDGGVDYPISYSFYLGENLVDDFNVEPNKSYTYAFEITSRGDADMDSRIEDWGLVDFSDTKYDLANSYIVNPPPSSWRNFRIPIQRIHDFWGTDLVHNYENQEYLSLRKNGDKWKAFILAADFELSDDKVRLTKKNGVVGVDSYFEVQISSDVERGNLIVAVGPDDAAENVSWSWHLWITDYNPEAALEMGNGTDGQYVYPVINGSVHRYQGDALWGKYKNKYIMDRNLGYGDNVHSYPLGNKGMVYYQYGRKDPFLYPAQTSNNYRYPANKTQHSFQSVDNSTTITDSYNTVTYAVTHPLHYIKGTVADHAGSLTTWCHTDFYNPNPVDKNRIWYDPMTTKGAEKEGQKSIFDPCPPGFRVPPTNTWADFRHNGDARPSTNVLKNTGDETLWGFKNVVEIKGLQYWPYVANQLVPEEVVFIPASSYVNPATSGGYLNLPQVGQWTFLWAEKASTNDAGFCITAQPAMLSPSHTTGQGRGLPVRCITDN